MAIFLCANTSYFRQYFFLLKIASSKILLTLPKGGRMYMYTLPPFMKCYVKKEFFIIAEN